MRRLPLVQNIERDKVVPMGPGANAKQRHFLDVTMSLIGQGDEIGGQSPDELPLESFMKLNVDALALNGPLKGKNDPNAPAIERPFYQWFQEFTGFELLLSGVVTGASTVVNLWWIDDASQVVKAWLKLGNAPDNSNAHFLKNTYFKLDDLVADEVQDIGVSFTAVNRPTVVDSGDPYYIRASCLLRTSDLDPFHAQNQKDKVPDGYQTILTTYAVTGELNLVHQYFCLVDKAIPHMGAGEPFWKTLEKQAANMLKKLDSYNLSFRTSVQLLRPSRYDPWFLRRNNGVAK